MNPSFNDSEAQRIRPGVYADGGADLVKGYLIYGIALFAQEGNRLITEGESFLPVITVSDGKTVTASPKSTFLQVFQKEGLWKLFK